MRLFVGILKMEDMLYLEYCTDEVYFVTVVFVKIHLSLLDQYVKYFFMVPHLCTFVGYEFFHYAC